MDGKVCDVHGDEHVEFSESAGWMAEDAVQTCFGMLPVHIIDTSFVAAEAELEWSEFKFQSRNLPIRRCIDCHK